MELEQHSEAMQHELERSRADDDENEGTDAEEEIEEIPVEPVVHNIYNKIYMMAEKFSSTRIGQFAIETGDHMLRIIENTAKWSLPQDKKEISLERPMPWIPFLAMIISLRVLRLWLTVAAIMIGNAPVMPYDMVYFIQTRRRKLRSIRMHGLKVIQQREAEAKAKRSSGNEANLMGKIRNLFSIAICRPGQRREQKTSVFMLVSGSTRETMMDRPINSERPSSKRRRDDESLDKNMTCDEMLTKYANENSDDDSDFIPTTADETNDDSTSSGSDAECDTSTEKSKERETQTADNGNANQTHDSSAVELEHSTSSSGRPKTYKHAYPIPLIEIKTEPLTDGDSGNEQQQQQQQKATTRKENGPSNGGGAAADENREAEVVKPIKNSTPTALDKLKATTNGNEKQQKSTPGHETAAAMKPKSAIMPIFTSTATAGSPPDFNACIKSARISKNPLTTQNPIQQQQQQQQQQQEKSVPIAHSTPEQQALDKTVVAGTETAADPNKRPQQHRTTTHHQQQHHHHHNRNRGKNRR